MDISKTPTPFLIFPNILFYCGNSCLSTNFSLSLSKKKKSNIIDKNVFLISTFWAEFRLVTIFKSHLPKSLKIKSCYHFGPYCHLTNINSFHVK